MARSRRRVARALAVAALSLGMLGASGSTLRRLHVDALSMRADRTQVQVGQVFHLAIHARVRERVAALDEVVVPDVGTMQLEGDERSVSASPSGTDVVETLTLEPTQPGTFTFNGAYLDAIDAKTNRPSRFSANPVRIVVTRGGTPPSGAVTEAAGLIVRLAIAAGGVAALASIAVVVVRRQRRRSALRAAPAPAAVRPSDAPAGHPRTVRDDVADALRRYRTAPANASLMELRAALFAAAGAAAGSTLRDALVQPTGAALRAALVAAERTAFGPAWLRDGASADLIEATETWLR